MFANATHPHRDIVLLREMPGSVFSVGELLQAIQTTIFVEIFHEIAFLTRRSIHRYGLLSLDIIVWYGLLVRYGLFVRYVLLVAVATVFDNFVANEFVSRQRHHIQIALTAHVTGEYAYAMCLLEVFLGFIFVREEFLAIDTMLAIECLHECVLLFGR